MKNKLIIAAAGSGKTTFIVNESLAVNDEAVLITTFTITNEQEIRNRIIAKNGYLPRNITVQTWFSFLLQHGVRPYQSVLNDQIHEINVGFLLTSEKSGQKFDASGNPIFIKKNDKDVPTYWGEKDFLKYYFTNSFKIYSDKISKFVCETDKTSNSEVISRISKIYQHIFIDEVQDLSGYDLDVVKLLFKSNSSVVLVGDPRQVTYETHHSMKYVKYANGNIKEFIQNELGKKVKCGIDETALSVSHRNNQLICDYSAKLYPALPIPLACKCNECRQDDEHLGVFIIKYSEIEQYLKTYNSIQLRWNAKSKVHPDYTVRNLGESKGATMDRVLIYPTKPILEWIKNNEYPLKNEARSKFYVGLTRARFSSTIVMDVEDDEIFEGVTIFSLGEK